MHRFTTGHLNHALYSPEQTQEMHSSQKKAGPGVDLEDTGYAVNETVLRGFEPDYLEKKSICETRFFG
jgi:hypothetical protein